MSEDERQSDLQASLHGERTLYRANGEPAGDIDAGPDQMRGASLPVDVGPWSQGLAAPPAPRRRSRHVARYVAPVVFLAVVLGLMAVIVKSGILDPKSGAVASPSASASPSPSAKPIVYKIKKDDTLSSIAVKFGTTVDAILVLNPDLSLNNLRVGQKIKVPRQQ